MQWTFLFIFIGQCCFITCQLYEYHFVEERKTWTEARQYCREKYSDLATVSNMTDMKRIINVSAKDRTEAWIGLYEQNGVKRTWHWSLSEVEFNQSETNWDTGEPDNVHFEEQNCGITWKSLKWGDYSCAEKCYFLCYNESSSPGSFHLIQDAKTWLEAQSYCRETHTDLISGWNQIQNVEHTNPNILDSVNDVVNTYIYVGLFRDSWIWSDGSSFSFRHWNPQFNIDQQHNSSQCAMTVFEEGDRWKNASCTEQKPFICYHDHVILIKESKTWEEALYYCRDHHHDLVTITNLDEQRWVQEKAKKASTPFVWMGLRYTCTLDFWFWVSDEVVSYKNWVSDGPMDGCDMSGAMATGGQHQWFKINDNEKFNFICSTS